MDLRGLVAARNVPIKKGQEMEPTKEEKERWHEKWTRTVIAHLEAGHFGDELLRSLQDPEEIEILNRRVSVALEIDRSIQYDRLSEEALMWWLRKCDEPLRRQLITADLADHGFDPFDEPEVVTTSALDPSETRICFTKDPRQRGRDFVQCKTFDSNTDRLLEEARRSLTQQAGPIRYEVRKLNRAHSVPSHPGKLGRRRAWQLEELGRLVVHLINNGCVTDDGKAVVFPIRERKRFWWVALRYLHQDQSYTLAHKGFDMCGGIALVAGDRFVTKVPA